MKVFYLGASMRAGRSSKNDSPYEIAELTYAAPDKSSTKNDPDGSVRWTYTGFGYRTFTMAIRPDCLEAFRDVKPGSMVELQVEPVPENPSRNQIIGVAA